jgi:hypothetical protein
VTATGLVRIGSAAAVTGVSRVFEIVGDITNVQVIASGRGIRRLKTLRKRHGGRRWRKLKGDATVRLVNGSLRRAEIDWYDAHGVGQARPENHAFLGLNIMRVQPSSQSFALCVEDGGMEDLEARKLYQIVPDREAA